MGTKEENLNFKRDELNSSSGTTLKDKINSEEEIRSILRARAKILAIKNMDETLQKEFIEVMEFGLASEHYCIETSFIREVYPLRDFTSLPGVPSFVLGIINVRGQIISVIDLKKFFNLPAKGIGELNKVIILSNEKMKFGILADIIYGTRSITLESIRKPTISVSGIGIDYLKSVTVEHNIILDAKKILEDKNIIVLQGEG